MALFGKKAITEREAAAALVQQVLLSAQEGWPTIYRGLREHHGSGFVVDDERFATFDLALALAAMELTAAANLYDLHTAERVQGWVIYHLNTPEHGAYCRQEIESYVEADKTSPPDNPIGPLATRLLQRWLGPRIVDFAITVGGRRTEYVQVLLMTEIKSYLAACLTGFWVRLRERYKLLPSNLPPN